MKIKLFATNEHLLDKESLKAISLSTKAIQIYRTKKEYKIVTLYKRESGSYLISNPIFIVPNDINIIKFNELIIKTLNASRLILEKEEDMFDINLLKELKESSYNNLYKNSTSCNVYIENQEVTIKPNVYFGSKGGLKTDNERIVSFSFSEDRYLEITNIIVDLLS